MAGVIFLIKQKATLRCSFFALSHGKDLWCGNRMNNMILLLSLTLLLLLSSTLVDVGWTGWRVYPPLTGIANHSKVVCSTILALIYQVSHQFYAVTARPTRTISFWSIIVLIIVL